MADVEWTPKSFFGTFDGQGHTISNLTVSGSGFFSGIYGGAVKDLHAGGIAGHIATGASITGCSFSGTVESSSYAGGIAGYANGSGGIAACYSAGEVKSTGSYAGGIAGYGRSEITACYSTASVSGSSAAGGVVGYMRNGDTTACYWSGSGPTSGVGYIYSSLSSSYTEDNTAKVENNGWSDAMSAMNEALSDNGYSYSYKENTGSDSESFPLVLE